MIALRAWRWPAGLACLLAASTAAAGDGWHFPSLFKEEKTEVPAYTPAPSISAAEAEEPPTSGFKFPKLKMPSAPKFGSSSSAPSASIAPKRSQPSTMQKLGKGTKRFFSKTADALTPWDNKEKPKPRAHAMGIQRSYNGSPSAAKEEKESSWLPSWFSKKEEPKVAETPSGFLGRPRPKY